MDAAAWWVPWQDTTTHTPHAGTVHTYSQKQISIVQSLKSGWICISWPSSHSWKPQKNSTKKPHQLLRLPREQPSSVRSAFWPSLTMTDTRHPPCYASPQRFLKLWSPSPTQKKLFTSRQVYLIPLQFKQKIFSCPSLNRPNANPYTCQDFQANTVVV